MPPRWGTYFWGDSAFLHKYRQQIGNLIREGELRKQEESTNESADYLKAEEVGAWWFHKNEPVKELPFDLVEGIEPEDHLDIAEDLYNRSAGLQNRIEETKGRNAVESDFDRLQHPGFRGHP